MKSSGIKRKKNDAMIVCEELMSSSESYRFMFLLLGEIIRNKASE
jgi:hypothetical protein